MMLDKDILFKRFEKLFPGMAGKAKDYKITAFRELTIKMQDESLVDYDDITKSARALPKDCDNMTEQECREECSKRLKGIMKLKGYSNSKLARETGISVMSISHYTNAKGNIPFARLDKICRVLGCDMEDLRYMGW